MKDPREYIDSLSPADAHEILKHLAREDADLASHIVEIAQRLLSRVDPEEIAETLYEELNALEVEEIWDRAGTTRHGYVDPGEAADEMIGEVLQPFMKKMNEYRLLGMSLQARKLCMGLLLGLFRFSVESKSDFKDWAPDSPAAFAEEVITVWKEGSPSQVDLASVRKFIQAEGMQWKLGLL